ncbi:DEAD/DEAH box helicase [Petrotoga sp. 9PWA.NaAc.5.4]|uniref:DEAD/DEAH box helicase n=1 Tax=Petrotoga sp. 9PWA.NaAc.5.4 TaxID=1434328 RepID=UPI000CC3154B|nr:DEAD/DEAH box helicase [Petrotoga sp. 9PWA.NaAc.5.4]PNR97068.1 DEAD/DEAH box helicase [Petrotoga sp. 9PWA.NaAc.5.4]
MLQNELIKFLNFLKNANKQTVVIVPENFFQEVEDDKILEYPDFDIFPYEELDVSPSIKAKRLKTLYYLLNKKNAPILTTLSALIKFTVPKKDFITKKYFLKDTFKMETKDLYQLGYTISEEVVNPGEFSKKGFVRDAYIPLYDYPLRIELFDNEIDRITFFDSYSQRSVQNLDCFELIPGSEILKFENNLKIYEKRIKYYMEKFKEENLITPDQLNTIPSIFYKDKNSLLSYLDNNSEIYIINKSDVIKSYAEKEKENYEMCDTPLKKNLYKTFSGHNIEIINELTYKELNLNLEKISFIKSKKEDKRIDYIPLLDWEDLKEGDLVVHEDYGIGIYHGVNKVETSLGLREYITLEYANSSKVYVPVGRLDKLSKYIGDPQVVTISSLNGKKWKNTKLKVQKEIREKIKELLKIYALRENQKGIRLEGDKELEEKFKSTFPYIETPDQEKSIKEILKDLESDKPMDRLLAGDSGFGKTEVAMRAAFRAVVSNYQVLLLAPTTILANQHYENFKERMEPFGVKIVLLTRHRTLKEKEAIFQEIKNGTIDIIIGTHTLLSDSLEIKKLGLVIVDEEQRFGVLQKEKFKKLSEGVNFLMMSATPIPRTLYMSISGLREISTISTPPLGRLPIQTYIGQYSDKIVRTAILREKARSGQTIFIHNRVQELDEIYKKLVLLVPEVKIKMIHGNTNKKEFAEVINDFYKGEIDVLLATTIIENGIDIPNVNTLIVDDSERYGISQLYQIKGRVGRSNKRGFAYFLYKKELSQEAKKRLEAIKQYNEPGSGLKLALRDMEIRGYGDILGIEQKGHINAIGLHLYQEMLNKVLFEYGIKKEEEIIKPQNYTEIKGIKGSLVIPEEYIPNSIERMRIYRRISVAKTPQEVEDIQAEVIDKYGRVPPSVERLFKYALIKVKASMEGIKEIDIGETYISFKFTDDVLPKIEKYNKFSRKTTFSPDTKELIAYGPKDEIQYMEKVFS